VRINPTSIGFKAGFTRTTVMSNFVFQLILRSNTVGAARYGCM